MKKIHLLLFLLLASSVLLAQTPESFNYQTVIRDSNGDVLVNQSVGFQISILESSATGTMVYTETHTVTTSAQGLATLIIGTGTTTDTFNTIDWSGNTHFLQIAVDVAGGTNYITIGTSQLLSVPYALNASKVDQLQGGTNGQVLSTDGNNNVSWIDSAPDNLGNHTATQNIQLNDNWLSNDGGSEGIRISDDGNVGIGNDNPLFNLDIIGDNGEDVIHRIQASGRGGVGQVYASGFTRYIKLAANDSGASFEGIPNGETGLTSNVPIVFSSNSTPNLSLETNGTVGVGKLDPNTAFALDVAGDVNIDGAITIDTFSSGIIVADTIGIATSNPEYKLDIGGDVGENAIQRISTGNGGVSELWLKSASNKNMRLVSNSLGAAYNGIPTGGNGITSDRPFYISINEGSNFSVNATGNVGIGTNSAQNGFKLDVNGNTNISGFLLGDNAGLDSLGIGTSNPTYKLHITGETGEDVIQRIATDGRGGIGELFISAFSRQLKIIANDSGADYEGISADETGFVSNRSMVFLSNNNINLSLEDDGKVGIGTNTSMSGFKLNVNGNTNITGSLQMVDGNQQDGYVLVSDASGLGSWQNPTTVYNQALSLDTNTLSISNSNSVDLSSFLDNTDEQTLLLATNMLSISNGNSVDLNAYLDNTDNQTIDVFQLSNNVLQLSLEDDGVATQSIDLSSFLDADNLGNHIASQNIQTSGNWISSDGDSEGIFMDANGLVGIGMNTPDSQLNVKSQAGGSNIKISPASSVGNARILFANDTETTLWSMGTLGTVGDFILFDKVNGKTPFWVKDGAESGTLFVDETSQVGIGTTDPLANLDIEGAADGDALLRFTTDRSWQFENQGTGANAELALKSLVNAKTFNIQTNDGSSAAEFFVSTNNHRVYLAPESGSRVGIGTRTPGYALQVGEQGDGTQARSNAWHTFSDRRWKTDFQVIQNALEKIQAVNGYYYKWKGKPDTSIQVGVIAQEIEAVLPEVVSTDDNGYKSVDYSKLTALLIEGMKAQQRQIETLEAKNTSLEIKNDQMEDRLTTIEEHLGITSNNTHTAKK